MADGVTRDWTGPGNNGDSSALPGAVQAPSADDYGGGLLGGIESWAAQAWNNVLSVVDGTIGDPNVANGSTPAYDGSDGTVGTVVAPIENAITNAGQAAASILPGSVGAWQAVIIAAIVLLVFYLIHEVKSA